MHPKGKQRQVLGHGDRSSADVVTDTSSESLPGLPFWCQRIR
jgi:hypothetical protein